SGQNTNEVTLAGSVIKIGEIARPANGDFFDTHLEFVDQDTLLMIDSPLASGLDTAANDSQVRALKRVSTSPGAATVNGALTEGGFNQGTTESWESVVLGQVNMDFDINGVPNGLSEIESIAYYADPITGVKGLWIGENDGGVNDTATPANNRGDDISFFEITNFSGTSGNGLRDFTVQGSAPRIILDDNPSVDPNANNGALDRIFVNSQNGNLVIVESGFFDVSQDEPSVITRVITSYDNGGKIEAGAWLPNKQLAVSGAIDDDTQITDGRWTVYDSANNDVYFYDLDSATDGSPLPIFNHDWYKLDLDTGITTLMAFNSDISNGLFSNGDQFAFFCLGAGCGATLLDGDLNGDGFVGIADLNIVLGNWNQNVTSGDLLQGDPSNDGFVGIADLNVVLGNWNAGTPPAGNAVPEPASLALFTIAGLSVTGRRRAKA
ncbi:MAG: PEP-CTERM sorting domain-containing protein, partial [Phycisphaerales bacterium]